MIWRFVSVFYTSVSICRSVCLFVFLFFMSISSFVSPAIPAVLSVSSSICLYACRFSSPSLAISRSLSVSLCVCLTVCASLYLSAPLSFLSVSPPVGLLCLSIYLLLSPGSSTVYICLSVFSNLLLSYDLNPPLFFLFSCIFLCLNLSF